MKTLTTSPRTARFCALLAPHERTMYGLASKMIGDAELATDLVQEATLKAFMAFDRYDDTRPIRPWLCSIVHNTCINELRRRARERRLRAELVRLDLQRADGVGDAELRLFARTLSAPVIRALTALPAQQREAVLMIDIWGYSYDEVATHQDCPKGTIMSRLHRGRERLKRALRGYARAQGISQRRRGCPSVAAAA
ncbi:MAG: RNA polymerase sigma factor [Bradymonadia bacterium]